MGGSIPRPPPLHELCTATLRLGLNFGPTAFINFHILYMQGVKALPKMWGCTGSCLVFSDLILYISVNSYGHV